MKTIRLCPNCGGPLPIDAVEGLCPQCLLKSTVVSDSLGATVSTTLLLSSEPVPGHSFGDYRIVRLLGRGGMGSVFEAEQIESGRRVALKVLSHAPDSPTTRQRFLREGRLAASINHPNSVYIFGTEEIGDTPVITMEYVSGGTLSERVKRQGPMSVGEAVDTILQVIAGLEAAASKGVLHRDVKPSNCFVEADGAVKVGDFGLSISTLARDQTNLTMSGAIMGTPAYASPEQLRGDELDVRADIYSVGVTLYFLLTGKTPFHSENMVNLIATVLEKPAPSPRAVRPEIPAGVERTVLRCLAKQSAQRFKDYEELRQALLPFGSAEPAAAPLGLRFLAGAIDFFLMIALAMVVTQFFVRIHGHDYSLLGDVRSPTILWLVAAAPIVVRVLYFAVFEGFWGVALGKQICRLRVIGPNRNRPGFLRALGRALIFVLAPYLPVWLLSSGSNVDLSPLMQAVGLSSFYFFFALLFASARRRNGFAALHDLITGTRVVERAGCERRSQQTSADDPTSQTGDAPNVGPFHVLDSLACHGGEEILLGYDTRLLRKVWIRKQPLGTAPIPAARRELTRKGRLHWLASRRSAEECWDAYEAVAGQPLVNLLNAPQPWASVRFWLHDLAEELDATRQDGSLPDAPGLERVWITADGRAKLLDFPAPGGGGTGAQVSKPPAEAGTSKPAAQGFLCQVAYAALAGRGFSEAASGSVPQTPLPMFAREFLQTMPAAQGFPSVLAQLRPLLDKPAVVSSAQRRGLMYLSILFAFMGSGVASMLFGLMLINGRLPDEMPFSELMPLSECLSYLDQRASDAADIKALEERNAMEIYLASRFRSTITNGAFWTDTVVQSMIPATQRRLAEQAVTVHPAPSEAEISEATAILSPLIKRLPGNASATNAKPAGLTNVRQRDVPEWSQELKERMMLGAFAIPSLAAALLFRRGLGYRLLRIEIVTKTGLPARRWRTFLRCLLAWLPFLLLLLLARATDSSWPFYPLLLIVVGGIVYRLVRPGRAIRDRLAGTWLVPK